MDNLNEPNKETISVGQQLGHLEKEIGILSDSISRLSGKLGPLMPPNPPPTCGGDVAEIATNQKSDMMEHAIQLTSRLRGLNSLVCNLELDLQI
jgi:hypothetical protein